MLMKTLIYFFIFFPSIVLAQAQVFPTRLTLTEEAPSSYLNLKNTTASPQKYRIELAQYLMKKDGTVVKANVENNPLTEVLKFSPKVVELAPNEKQVVRVMATAFDDLTDGDYYVYLHFIPESGSASSSPTKAKFSLQARIAVAVPVVVRHGTAKVDGKLTELKAANVKNGDLEVTFKLANSTKYFLTGNLDIIGVTDKGETVLSQTIGITSYIPSRTVKTSVTTKDVAEKLNGESLKKVKVKFASNENSGTTFELLGEATLDSSSSAKKTKKVSKQR